MVVYNIRTNDEEGDFAVDLTLGTNELLQVVGAVGEVLNVTLVAATQAMAPVVMAKDGIALLGQGMRQVAVAPNVLVDTMRKENAGGRRHAVFGHPGPDGRRGREGSLYEGGLTDGPPCMPIPIPTDKCSDRTQKTEHEQIAVPKKSNVPSEEPPSMYVGSDIGCLLGVLPRCLCLVSVDAVVQQVLVHGHGFVWLCHVCACVEL